MDSSVHFIIFFSLTFYLVLIYLLSYYYYYSPSCLIKKNFSFIFKCTSAFFQSRYVCSQREGEIHVYVFAYIHTCSFQSLNIVEKQKLLRNFILPNFFFIIIIIAANHKNFISTFIHNPFCLITL